MKFHQFGPFGKIHYCPATPWKKLSDAHHGADVLSVGLCSALRTVCSGLESMQGTASLS